MTGRKEGNMKNLILVNDSEYIEYRIYAQDLRPSMCDNIDTKMFRIFRPWRDIDITGNDNDFQEFKNEIDNLVGRWYSIYSIQMELDGTWYELLN